MNETKETKQETKVVPAPHDKGYKKDLSNPKEFLHFLKKYVGAEWMKDLEVTQLRLCDKEFVDKDYEGKEADLIYEITRDARERIIVFVLQELQSTVDFTMIFRVLIYVVNNLLRYFMATDRDERERKDFRLPAMVAIVFYNGEQPWTAMRNLRDYQYGGNIFGEYVLNMEYYLVDLSDIDEEYILSTNTVIDNIMYCDKFRKKLELADAVRTAYSRVQTLDSQEKEEFNNWVKNILLSICGNKEALVEEILSWAESGNGDGDMAFKYNIIKAFEDEREEGKAEGKAEDILELLADLGPVGDDLRKEILAQKDLAILKQWLKTAARAGSIDEFIKVLH